MAYADEMYEVGILEETALEEMVAADERMQDEDSVVWDDFPMEYEYEDYGYEDYEPSPYDGTYSEM